MARVTCVYGGSIGGQSFPYVTSLQHFNNGNIHNSPSCPSVVETTNKERNKQQNPRIAGSQSVYSTESCMHVLTMKAIVSSQTV